MNEPVVTATEGSAPRRGPALFVAVGSVSMIVGSFLSFATAKLSVSGTSGSGTFDLDSVTGTDTADGKFFVVAGLVLAIVALVLLARTSTGVRTAAVMIALFGSLLVFYMSMADLFTIRGDLQDDLFGSLSGPLSDIPRAEFDAFVHIQIGVGLFLVIVGAALGVIGGTMALLTYRRDGRAA